MKYRLISIGIWAGVIVLTVLLWIFSVLSVLLTGLWDPDRRFTHRFAVYWGWAMVRMNPLWNLEVIGREHLKPARSYVVVSNHQSFADVVVLPFIGVPYKCFAKSPLFRVPFFGWSLGLHRHINLRRGSAHGIHQAMEEARRYISRGMPVVFFAEGTRSRTGKLAPFKGGAFRLAIETKTPILPLVITGTREALPRGTWVFRHRVDGAVNILPPIDAASYGMADSEILKKRVFHEMEQVFNAAKSEAGSA